MENSDILKMNDPTTEFITRLQLFEKTADKVEDDILELERRLLEQRSANNERTELVKEEISKVKQELVDLNSLMDLIIRDLRGTAKKTNIEALRITTEKWTPENWVTKKDFCAMLGMED